MTSISGRTGPHAWILAGGLLACGSMVGLAAFVPVAGVATRLGLHTWDAGHMLAIGVALAAWTAATARIRGASMWSTLVIVVGIALAVVPPDVQGPAQRLQATTGIAGWTWPIAIAVAVGVASCEWVGRVLRRSSRLATTAVGLAVALVAANHAIVVQRHPGLHLMLALAAAALIAGSLAPGTSRRAGQSTAIVAALGLSSVAIGPPPAVAARMADARGCVLFPWLPSLRTIAAEAPAGLADDPWFRSRASLPEVAPSTGWQRPVAPVVVLLTIDALRADALTDPADADATTSLRELAAASLWFTQARSTSSRTLASLSSLFAGRTFSMLRWDGKWHPRLGMAVWPEQAGRSSLAARLNDAGVHTINVASVDYLVDAYGVVPGFAEEIVVDVASGVGPAREPTWASATAVIDAMTSRLAVAAAAPRGAFLFAHLLDAHEPYNRGSSCEGDDARARWRSELATVDAEIARLFAAIEAAGLGERAVVIITADHGEAFGTHGSWAHGTTLYDDVLRVPVLIHAPGVVPGRIDTPISTIDLGPTILDLFELATPGSWMGQSLGPALAGQRLTSSRPIVFEALPKQGLLGADGIKVIRDRRHRTVEIFDTRGDPDEQHNLFDGAVADARLGTIAAYFDAHEFSAPGYTTPVR